MVMSYFQRVRPQGEVGSFYTIGTQKKTDAYSVEGFCGHCNTKFEAMGCYNHFCLCHEARPALIEEDIQRGRRKRELDELQKQHLKEKSYYVFEMYECD